MEGQWGQRRVCGGQWRVSGGLWGQLPPFLPLKGTWAAAAEEVDVCYARALSGFLMVLSDGGDMIFLSENVSRLLGLGQVSVQGHLCKGGRAKGPRARGGGGTCEGVLGKGGVGGEGVNVGKGSLCESACARCPRARCPRAREGACKGVL